MGKRWEEPIEAHKDEAGYCTERDTWITRVRDGKNNKKWHPRMQTEPKEKINLELSGQTRN